MIKHAGLLVVFAAARFRYLMDSNAHHGQLA